MHYSQSPRLLFFAVLVVLPHVGNLSSRELTLLGQAFAALVNVEPRDQR